MYQMTSRTSHRLIDVAVFRGIFGNKPLNAVSAVGAPVYGWFTEGFDTLDLKEAKALLDELQT